MRQLTFFNYYIQISVTTQTLFTRAKMKFE